MRARGRKSKSPALARTKHFRRLANNATRPNSERKPRRSATNDTPRPATAKITFKRFAIGPRGTTTLLGPGTLITAASVNIRPLLETRGNFPQPAIWAIGGIAIFGPMRSLPLGRIPRSTLQIEIRIAGCPNEAADLLQELEFPLNQLRSRKPPG